MIYLIGNPQVKAVMDTRRALESKGLSTKILVPNRHWVRPAEDAGIFEIPFGDIYSLFYYLVKPENERIKNYTIDDFVAPEGYKPEGEVKSLKYIATDSKYLIINTFKYTEIISNITYFENDEWVRKEEYNDVGRLINVQFPQGPDSEKIQVVSHDGSIAFEFETEGKYRSPKNINSIAENLSFENEASFYAYVIRKISEGKAINDKIFVMDHQVSHALVNELFFNRSFSKNGLYLLVTENIQAILNEERKRHTIPRYESVIFNTLEEMQMFLPHFEEKAKPRFYFNNFTTIDTIPKIKTENKSLFFTIGTTDAEEFMTNLNKFLETHTNTKIYLYTVNPEQNKIITESIPEKFKEQIEVLFNTPIQIVEEKVAQSEAYIFCHEGLAVQISEEWERAIGAHLPVFTLPTLEGLDVYINRDSGRVVSKENLFNVLEQFLSMSDYRSYADDPKGFQEQFSVEKTGERWLEILNDKSIQL